MKRIGYLYEQIYDWDNLLKAFHDAKKGKISADLSEFEYCWETNLLDMHARLREQTYQFGAYRHFEIYEPKQRTISCAPFRDRVPLKLLLPFDLRLNGSLSYLIQAST